MKSQSHLVELMCTSAVERSMRPRCLVVHCHSCSSCLFHQTRFGDPY
jgi:hypothetical protein